MYVLWGVLKDTINAWVKHNASSLGAALSFYTWIRARSRPS